MSKDVELIDLATGETIKASSRDIDESSSSLFSYRLFWVMVISILIYGSSVYYRHFSARMDDISVELEVQVASDVFHTSDPGDLAVLRFLADDNDKGQSDTANTDAINDVLHGLKVNPGKIDDWREQGGGTSFSWVER